MSNAELVQAFRRLYRSALRAVQYSKPARYVVRDQLRAAFRGQHSPLTASPKHRPAGGGGGGDPHTGRAAVFDPEAVRRTVWFLNAAAASRGLEHRIVRNLVLTAYWRRRRAALLQPTWSNVVARKKEKPVDEIEERAYDHYDLTIQRLNETMGLCLR
ncbi:mitochondrial carrier protein [Niveomyces insectorum RCEF 264]|uniref:Mitochondrial carrier protein n=1 Tax=Niveomyces insectorum RCEF 264 TaxID=1081102 RepID=A0A168AID5_9HYPO|nr:mitochondrial carrier protein [Niveomyces insectorum RCEF 264]